MTAFSIARSPRQLSALLALPLALSLAACDRGGKGTRANNLGNVPDQTEGVDLQLVEREISAVLGDTKVEVTLTPRAMDALTVNGVAKVSLLHLDGSAVGAAERAFQATQIGEPLTISLRTDAPITGEESGDYLIAYELRSPLSMLQGRRSLFAAMSHRAVRVLSSDRLAAGEVSHVRVIARDPSSGQPLAAMPISVALERDGDRMQVFSGETNDKGEASAAFDVPDEKGLDSAELVVEAGGTDTDSPEVVKSSVAIERQLRVLLTTDKPLYQPGQLIHMRALALRRPSLAPVADSGFLFEVADAKGNKVFKEEIQSNAFGIAATQFQLATRLNEGAYTVRCIVDEVATEKTVTVERYVLPKFNMTTQTDRAFYRPADVVRVSGNATYFFGQPVRSGSVVAQPWKFDVEFQPLGVELMTTTDAEGNFELEFQLPAFFVGQALLQGEAFVRVDIQVADTAGQSISKSLSVPVSESAIIQALIPEGLNVVPGVPNAFYLLTSSPSGAPVQTRSRITGGATAVEAQTDDRGVARVVITPQTSQLQLNVFSESVAGNGDSTSNSFNFGGTAENRGSVLLTTSGNLFAVGDAVEVEALVRQPEGRPERIERVFLDVIRGNQTVATESLSLDDDGRARHTLDLDAALSGNLEITAYVLDPSGDLIRDRRLVYVDPADDLNIAITPDKDVYEPGQEAKLSIEVTDQSGAGVPAALGIQVVDEAVFALQEFQPGLEKLFFKLQEELLQPRYQINGFSTSELVQGGGADEAPEVRDARDQAAGVIFAASQGFAGFGIDEDTFTVKLTRARAFADAQAGRDLSTIVDLFAKMVGDGDLDYDGVEDLVARKATAFADPWGQSYTLAVDHSWLKLSTAGPDETAGTEDDGSAQISRWEIFNRADRAQNRGNGGDEAFDDGGPFPGAGGGGGDGFGGDPAAPPQAEEPAPVDADGDGLATGGGGEGGGANPPRIRSFFPETLFVEPSLITEPDGTAELSIPMADSITTWRMTSMANSAHGELGSNTSGIRVFLPFFVDIDMPRTLTQRDEVEIPLAIFNFLDESQEVRVELDAQRSGDWFTLLDETSKTVTAEPGGAVGLSFRVRVNDVGWHGLTFFAYGSDRADAIERRVEIEPYGQEQVVNFSDRLGTEPVQHTVTMPPTAVPGASSIVVKVYPGLFSQAVEGLDSILRQPSGCFEQTSSTTYPNILVLNYMRETGTVTPELELKALNFINQGYQRLLSFEVDGGGFEWFGNTPAHRFLSAYGLLEFADMSRVHSIDMNVINRTQDWLAGQQESDGRWASQREGIHEGATNRFQEDDLLSTAYITYAMYESARIADGVNLTAAAQQAAQRGLNYVRQNLSDAEDNYALAMIANAFVAAGVPNEAQSVIDQLEANKTEDDGAFYWQSGVQTQTYSTGASAHMETTALTLYAYLRAGAHPATAEGAITWLTRNKDRFGNWESTQATILTLRAFLESLRNQAQPANATVRVLLDGNEAASFDVDDSNSDVMRIIDLSPSVHTGDNVVRLELEGEGAFLYQVVGSHFLPWELVGGEPVEPLAIDVAYDRTNLEVDEVITANVNVRNNTSGTVSMVLVDLGLPPGFDLVSEGLQAGVESGLLSRFEVAGNQLQVYAYNIEPGATLQFSYGLRARFPLRAATPRSEAYAYYDRSVRGESAPQELEVSAPAAP